MVIMWVFVGIEGAAMMSDRASSKKIVGKSNRIWIDWFVDCLHLSFNLAIWYYEPGEGGKFAKSCYGYVLASMLEIGSQLWSILPSSFLFLVVGFLGPCCQQKRR